MSAMDPLADQDKLRKVLSGQSMELCNFLQNVVAITYIFGLQQPTFLLCNFLHLYSATNIYIYILQQTSKGTDYCFLVRRKRHWRKAILLLAAKSTKESSSDCSGCSASIVPSGRSPGFICRDIIFPADTDIILCRS